MTIITNTEITNLMKATPSLIKGFDVAFLQACSYDLGIGTIFHAGQAINDKHKNATESVIIAPGEVVTMLTLEELSLPANIAATAYAMNGQSSGGLLVLNPGHIDPGFSGPLTVMAINLRKSNLSLSIGDRIFTVVFQRLNEAANPPYSRNRNRAAREKEGVENDNDKSIKALQNLLEINYPKF